MQPLLTVFIVILTWASIWDLLDILLNKVTEGVTDKQRVRVKTIIYIIIIILGILYAKQTNIKFF